jgi:hypothetical protein
MATYVRRMARASQREGRQPWRIWVNPRFVCVPCGKIYGESFLPQRSQRIPQRTQRYSVQLDAIAVRASFQYCEFFLLTSFRCNLQVFSIFP